jgi:hypothetical protein
MGWACGPYRRQDSFIQGFGEDITCKEITSKMNAQMEDNIKMDLQ